MGSMVQELHFLHLDIPITIERIDPVLPDGPNSAYDVHDSLYLSNLDDMVGTRVFTPTVHFYRSSGINSHHENVAQKLKDALRSVLVPYYPFTGRLRVTKRGKLEVFFGPDQGAVFVEAHTDLSLADLGELSMPNPAWINLIYSYPDEEQYKVIDMPLLIAQLTKFKCGGFSLGLRVCHCLCDGLGAMQFLSTWAQTAKTGSLVLKPKPCWGREFFKPRNPPEIRFPHAEFNRVDERSTLTDSIWGAKLVQKCYRMTREFQAHVKRLTQLSGEFPCTSFDAMAAHVWRSWVKALNVKPLDCELRLTFSVNARPKLENPPLEDGFYGNALCVVCATSTVNALTKGSQAEVARLVHEARLSISEEYVRSTVDYIELFRPERLEFAGKLTITQWTRFCIYESTDFGWGKPIYAGPIDLTPTPQVCVFLPEGGEAESSGAMLMCICLPEFACKRFKELLYLV